jgi:hypothetical protein
MFMIFYDGDTEEYLVQAQAYCGELMTYGAFLEEAEAVALRNRLEAAAMGEVARLDALAHREVA